MSESKPAMPTGTDPASTAPGAGTVPGAVRGLIAVPWLEGRLESSFAPVCDGDACTVPTSLAVPPFQIAEDDG